MFIKNQLGIALHNLPIPAIRLVFSTLLSHEIGEADSYSSRSCMIVTGLWKPKSDETNKEEELNAISAVAKEAGIDENDFRKHVNKIHPIGGAKNGNQVGIIKFTTHSFKEKVFLQHKRNKKIDYGKKKKIQNTSPRCGWTFKTENMSSKEDIINIISAYCEEDEF